MNRKSKTYLIEGMGWKSKPEIIKLIDDGRVDGVRSWVWTAPDWEIAKNVLKKVLK